MIEKYVNIETKAEYSKEELIQFPHHELCGNQFDDQRNINLNIFKVVSQERWNQLQKHEQWSQLKQEIVRVKEKIEQVNYGMHRDDHQQNLARFREIIEQLRILESQLNL